MQTPVEIAFQGMQGRPDIRASIEKHVAHLERRYGRVTACRVVLKGPGGHHRTGGLYEVNILLALPDGREVSAGRTPSADERNADLSFAINDAFKHANATTAAGPCPQLAGQVKQHESQPIATVKAIDPSGEFGSCRPPTVMRSTFIEIACLAVHSTASLWVPALHSPRKWVRRDPRRARSSCWASTD